MEFDRGGEITPHSLTMLLLGFSGHPIVQAIDAAVGSSFDERLGDMEAAKDRLEMLTRLRDDFIQHYTLMSYFEFLAKRQQAP